MKQKCIVIALLVLFIVFSVNAQSTDVNTQIISGIPNLKIGDQLPDFLIPKIFNRPKRVVNTKDFKDQLLIIDFWSTWCSGCVAALPKMDSLQKKFKNKIMILPVTNQTESIVSSFWKANKYTRNLSLPSVVEDRILSSYFKHRTIPHEIWIYKRKVIGITTAEYVDSFNIQKVLNGAAVNWPVKNDFYIFDKNKPLFNIDITNIKKYAAIDNYREGVNSEGFSGGSGIIRDSKSKSIRAFFLNQPILNSYQYYWARIVDMHSLIKPSSAFSPNQFLFEITDGSKYQYISKKVSGYEQDWIRKNGICFESINLDTGQTDKEVCKTVILDLNRLLGLSVKWEKRKEKVLILIKNIEGDGLKNKEATLADKTTSFIISSFINEDTLIKFQAKTLNKLSSRMNQEAINPYVFDETGYKHDINIEIHIPSWTDINAIRKAIQPYGLSLKEEERLVDKFVIRGVK